MKRAVCIAGALLAVIVLNGCAGTQSPEIVIPPPDASRWSTPSGKLAQQGPYLPDVDLRVCATTVSNAPTADSQGRVTGFNPLILVGGKVILATAPANNVCLSSGFGPRAGRLHEGIDLQARPAGVVFSAGPGLVREASRASGYGLQVVIDHGSGVFTRYAHLQNISPDITPGARIGFGQPLGLMGETGNATAIHLHYEVLTGQWGPRGSYGLGVHDPLSFPAYEWDAAGS